MDPDPYTKFIASTADEVRRAQFFVLPDGGQFFDKIDNEALVWRLPYQSIFIEFTAEGSLPDRVVLATQVADDLLSVAPYLFSEGEYRSAPLWGAVGPNPVLAEMTVQEPQPEDGHKAVSPELLGQNPGRYFKMATFPLGSDAMPMTDEMRKVCMGYLGDAANALLQLLAVLGCDNVGTESRTRRVVTKHGKKRITRKLTYHVVDLPGVYKHEAQRMAGGIHASPRMHFRRGHIRCLSTGVKTWVRECLVNAGSDNGFVDKHYEVSV